jgi:hypothetical protein
MFMQIEPRRSRAALPATQRGTSEQLPDRNLRPASDVGPTLIASFSTRWEIRQRSNRPIFVGTLFRVPDSHTFWWNAALGCLIRQNALKSAAEFERNAESR